VDNTNCELSLSQNVNTCLRRKTNRRVSTKHLGVFEVLFVFILFNNVFNSYASISSIFFHGSTALVGQGLLIVQALQSHSDTPHSVGLLWTSDRPKAEVSI
jgi:uncharacterized membrane protein HdeD (DUF308 family)